MPTGYTSIIEDKKDVTFPEFLWRCARAFGSFVTIRDDSLDAPIPERFEPSEYHVKALVAAESRLESLRSMKAADATKAAAAEHGRLIRDWERGEAKRKALYARYAAIRAQADKWRPPSSDHEGLRTFMLQQIDESTRFLGDMGLAPAEKDGATWLSDQIASAAWDVEYHTKQLREERERVASRNAWIAALRKSVPLPPSARAALKRRTPDPRTRPKFSCRDCAS